MKKQFYVSQNQVYKEAYLVVDYGLYKDYIILKNKKEKGFEICEEKKESKKTDQEEIARVSNSRIKSKIKELALCNDFEYFYTQTLKENRYDLDEFVQQIKKRFKAYKRKNKDFIYLIIFEKHKDGAYHLHGLVGGLGIDVYKNQNGYLSLYDFEELGFNSLSKIKDKIKVSSYITKYITKDFVKTSSGYSYFHSKDLNFARRFYLDDVDTTKLKLSFESEFIKIYKEQ